MKQLLSHDAYFYGYRIGTRFLYRIVNIVERCDKLLEKYSKNIH